MIFSGTKGLVALCLLMLVERGVLDIDAPVARYWPEFAADGKADIRVREHRLATRRAAGHPRARSTHDEVLDDRRMAALLARSSRRRRIRGARLAYHAMTYGWLCGELVRRIDGRSVGRFFADEVAAPLGLELWIGLPPGARAEGLAACLRAGLGRGRHGAPRTSRATSS